MAHQNLATVTNELIESYGNTAKNVINACRVGNGRAVVFVDQRFVAALDKASSLLSAKTRKSAVAAEKKLTAQYVKGVEMTSHNAKIAVNKAVALAGKGVVQVAANASRFEKSTGVTALRVLATAAVPAVQSVNKVAAKIEVRSGALATRIAGKPVKAKPVKAKVVKAKLVKAKVVGVNRVAAKKVVQPVKTA